MNNIKIKRDMTDYSLPPLLLRLYGDTENQPELRSICLDTIDRLVENNPGSFKTIIDKNQR